VVHARRDDLWVAYSPGVLLAVVRHLAKLGGFLFVAGLHGVEILPAINAVLIVDI
jgi:hypothetical protein